MHSIQSSSFTCHVNIKICWKKLNLSKDLLSAAYSAQKKNLQEVSEVTPMTCLFLTLFINCNLSCSSFLRSRQNPAISFPLLN